MSDDGAAIPQVALIGLFVTALVTAQVTAAKILAIDLPFAIPVAGDQLFIPGAALAYALTFFASDCYAELYGRRAAQVVVNVGFALNFVLLALVWGTIYAPIAPEGVTAVSQPAFEATLGPSTGVVVGSLVAYLVSQNWDVLVFHRIKAATEGRHLWLRNLGSTATSQLIDTVLFIGIAFVGFLGLPLSQALSLIVGQYLLKLAIALIDTPFVYLVVELVPDRPGGDRLAFGR